MNCECECKKCKVQKQIEKVCTNYEIPYSPLSENTACYSIGLVSIYKHSEGFYLGVPSVRFYEIDVPNLQRSMSAAAIILNILNNQSN